eukprot:gene24517-biopygen5936
MSPVGFGSNGGVILPHSRDMVAMGSFPPQRSSGSLLQALPRVLGDPQEDCEPVPTPALPKLPGNEGDDPQREAPLAHTARRWCTAVQIMYVVVWLSIPRGGTDLEVDSTPSPFPKWLA